MPPALRLAVGTLTVVPAGPVEVTPSVARWAMIVAPVAVLPLALVAAGLSWAGQALGLPGLLIGFVVVGALAVGSRALHLDGLADTVDGLGSGRTRDRALQIMRTGDVGPMGAVALIVVLGVQASSFGTVSPLAAGVAVGVSRGALLIACATGVPAARSDGLGAAVAGVVPRWVAGVGWVALAGALALVGTPWWEGPIIALAAAMAVLMVVGHCVRHLGGVTGDVLGACVEVCLTVLLVGLVVCEALP